MGSGLDEFQHIIENPIKDTLPQPHDVLTNQCTDQFLQIKTNIFYMSSLVHDVLTKQCTDQFLQIKTNIFYMSSLVF